MDPFVRLPEYPFVICRVCTFACVVDEVPAHLKKHHITINASERQRIHTVVSTIPGLIRNQAELRTFEPPEPTTEPIPFIAAPKSDGLACRTCRYVARHRQLIQNHCHKEHGWINERKRGGNVTNQSKVARFLPWTTGVRCQRFFSSRAASGWFEVNREGAEMEHDEIDAETPIQQFRKAHEAQEQRFQSRSQTIIKVASDRVEPSGWLDFVGWAQHLEGLRSEALRETPKPAGESEVALKRGWSILEQVMDQARVAATPKRAGRPALFEIQRKDMHLKPNRPFDNRLEDDTWARYKDVFRKLMCMLWRFEDWEDDQRPPYRLTGRQGDQWDSFREAIEEEVAEGSAKVEQEALERMCLDTVIGWLDHSLKQDHYDNVVISGLAVMGIREDGGWEDVINYTPVYSAVIKVARMLVVYQAYLEREDEVAALMAATNEQGQPKMDEEEARDEAQSTFRLVRGKVERFMTRTTGRPEAEPTPMDWIFEARTYGMHIRFNTVAGGSIDWDGDRVSYKQIKFSVGQLTEMLHQLVQESRELLEELTMVEAEGLGAVPGIEWSKMEDDHSEDRVGYSFLEDDRNGWLEKGHGWVLNRIVDSRKRRDRWISVRSESGAPYKADAVRGYGRKLEQFRERMFLLMHMMSMPARIPEISGIRFCNTVNGGVRNIFAHNRMICFVTSYHKNFRRTGQSKIIHRYLPREVGELLVWYLWLVLPFWQQVQGILKGADERSAFLWADEIVKSREGEGKEEERERRSKEREDGKVKADREVSEAEAEGFKDWLDERKWTSDRVRRIMQQHSERLLQARLNISSWRHIAIAIANRYLNRSFGQDETGGEGDEEEGDGLDDNAVDLQTGHGTHVAGMVYARELQQGQFGTAQRRDQFRHVSRQWHRFFDFGAEDRSGVGPVKRGREPFDTAREDTRFRRFARLQQVDMRGQLRMMMGPGAEFRGQQQQVIRAIVRGEGPIVQITGTGGGKSLSFMLPAFCSRDGTTIVIVPLVSLREDMHGRCEESGIESHVWQSRQGNRVATIVFVTPESAVTKGFRDFVNRLQSRQALDRVVVDECHVLLDGDPGFRPQLRELGGVLRDWGVQTIFLTATLAPADEDEFFWTAGLSRRLVRMFRSRTTRKNIRYRVETVEVEDADEQEEEEDKKVCEIVRRWIDEEGDGRVIVYAGSIERVEGLREALGCEAFHSKVDTAEGKAKRLTAWKKEGKLVVATNALGLGVDVPDVRLVVHAGMPRRLRDYVQESGRAGRDGCKSEAVVVCQNRPRLDLRSDGAGKGRWEAAVEDFVREDCCRRLVLDKVMDGWTQRSKCEEGEESCDICEEGNWRAAEEEGLLEEEEAAGGASEIQEIRERFERVRRRERIGVWQAGGARMQAAEEAEEFREQLVRWRGRCIVCVISQGRGAHHGMEECPQRGGENWQRVQANMAVLEEEMFARRRFEEFAGCYWCGLPQSICERWEEIVDEDGLRFRLVGGRSCQYTGLVASIYGGAYCFYKEDTIREMDRIMAEGGLVTEDEARWFRWLGEKVKWGGMETNRLCEGFFRLCRLIERGGLES